MVCWYLFWLTSDSIDLPHETQGWILVWLLQVQDHHIFISFYMLSEVCWGLRSDPMSKRREPFINDVIMYQMGTEQFVSDVILYQRDMKHLLLMWFYMKGHATNSTAHKTFDRGFYLIDKKRIKPVSVVSSSSSLWRHDILTSNCLQRLWQY